VDTISIPVHSEFADHDRMAFSSHSDRLSLCVDEMMNPTTPLTYALYRARMSSSAVAAGRAAVITGPQQET
jgi:hypothetical protein